MKAIRNSGSTFPVLYFVLAMLFLIATGFKSTDTNQLKPTTHVVTIYQMKFDPENIKVNKGDVVEWINKDFVPHDVTEINKKWKSKPLKQGEKFSKVITEDFAYFCSIHVVMKGSVTPSD